MYKETSTTDEDFCSQVIETWFEDGGTPGHPTTWQGVYDLLLGVEEKRLAKKLKIALEAHQVHLSDIEPPSDDEELHGRGEH